MAAILFVAAPLLSSDTSTVRLASGNDNHSPSLRASRKMRRMRP